MPVDVHETKPIEIPSGLGVKFSDVSHSKLIARRGEQQVVAFNLFHSSPLRRLVSKALGNRKSDYPPIVTLHRIIFGRPGEHGKRKGNLRAFHGFATGEVSNIFLTLIMQRMALTTTISGEDVSVYV
jgi:hypothetical protein